MKLSLWLDLLCLLFIGLKLGHIIFWSWWLVLLPALWWLYLIAALIVSTITAGAIVLAGAGLIDLKNAANRKGSIAYGRWR